LVWKIPRMSWQSLIDKVADNLSPWKQRLINRSSKLAWIKSTQTTMTIYTTIAVGLPPWVYKVLDKIIKAFLWEGSEEVHDGKCQLAWKKVVCPRELGSLSILDLIKLLGSTLHLRWIWLQQCGPTQP
jgi:hypothetical protein